MVSFNSNFNEAIESVTVNTIRKLIFEIKWDGYRAVAELNGKDTPTDGDPKDPVRAGIRLLVHPGDVIYAEVFVKYTNFDKYNLNGIPLAASLLKTLFAPVVPGSEAHIFDVVDDPSFADWPAEVKQSIRNSTLQGY